MRRKSRPILYIMKHKMSGDVDEHDGITDNPEAWLKQRNQQNELEDFYEPETLDEFWVDEINVHYYNNKTIGR